MKINDHITPKLIAREHSNFSQKLSSEKTTFLFSPRAFNQID